MARLGERPRGVGEMLWIVHAQSTTYYLWQSRPHALPRTCPNQFCLCERMRNIRHRARVQLGKHSGRLLAHRRKAIAEPTESTTGERFELAPEGANMEAVEIIAVSLLQSQQFWQIPRIAQI